MASLEIHVFGPMLVLLDGEPLPRLRSRKTLWLLALLSMRANRPVERGWLAMTLWPDAETGVAYSSLRSVVSDLRRALADHGGRLRTPDRNSILFDAEGVDLDVVRFDEAVRDGDHGAAAAAYRGPLLEGCGEEWAGQERMGRQAEAIHALQSLGERALLRGDASEAAVCFSRAVAVDASRDVPRRGLMEALASSGDLNGALQVYREFDRFLRAEVGAAPDATTTELYVRLRNETRRHGTKRHAGGRRDSPGLGDRLPHAITPLVGREDERADLALILKEARLVTLVGAGGIGKTRLALEVARDTLGEAHDGAWFVALEGVSDSRDVAQEIAASLEILEERTRTPLQGVLRALRGKRALVVLDNCEHVLASCAQIAATLLRECGEVRVLATSREPLGLTGERVWPVPALAFPDPSGLPEGRSTLLRVMDGYEGVRLFAERARAASPDFEITAQNAHDVARVCASLEGVPLALELAAARVRVLGVSGVVERLGDRLGLLTGRGGPSKRQQTLRATLDWSHSLLRPDEQRLFRRLGVFARGWTLDAATAVLGEDALEGLESLLDKSLVLRDAENRYRFLETVRQYATERLGASGEMKEAEGRFGAWTLSLVLQARDGLPTPRQMDWVRSLDVEMDNVRAALALPTLAISEGLTIAGSLAGYWYIRNRYSEGIGLIASALARDHAEEPTQARARAHGGMGMLAYGQGDLRLAAHHYEAAMRLHRVLKDDRGIASSLANLANVAYYRREIHKAIDCYEESLAYYRAIDDRRNVALLLSNLGTMRQVLGHPGARENCLESLALFREVGDDRMVGTVVRELGRIAYDAASYGEAQALYEEALALHLAVGDEDGVAWAHHDLSLNLTELGRDEDAAERMAEACRIFETLGDRRGLAAALMAQGRLSLKEGDPLAARQLVGRALALYEELGNARDRLDAVVVLGDVALAAGDLGDAEGLYREVLRLGLEEDNRFHVAIVLESFAALCLAIDDPRLGVVCLSEAERLRKANGTPLPNSRRRGLESCAQAFAERLGHPTMQTVRSRTDWREVVENILREGPTFGS